MNFFTLWFLSVAWLIDSGAWYMLHTSLLNAVISWKQSLSAEIIARNHISHVFPVGNKDNYHERVPSRTENVEYYLWHCGGYVPVFCFWETVMCHCVKARRIRYHLSADLSSNLGLTTLSFDRSYVCTASFRHAVCAKLSFAIDLSKDRVMPCW